MAGYRGWEWERRVWWRVREARASHLPPSASVAVPPRPLAPAHLSQRPFHQRPERQPALAAREARPRYVSCACMNSPFEGAWVEGGWGGGKALILRPPSHNSQSAPARAQVRHWHCCGRHEQLRLPTTGIVGRMLRDGGYHRLQLRHERAIARVRSDPAVHAALVATVGQ